MESLSQKRLEQSRSLGEVAKTIALGIRIQKRLSNNMTEEERIKFEQDIQEWNMERIYMEKSRSFDNRYFFQQQ